LLEYDVVNRFDNLTKEGCGQGAGEDIKLTTDNGTLKIQCKTVRLNQLGNIGWTTKSGLWDSKRGKKLLAKEWDHNHNSYFENYDFFMYLDISEFAPIYKTILIPTAELWRHDDIERQQNEYHYGKAGRARTYCDPPDRWQYPTHVTKSMYEEWKLRGEKIDG
jgi:hypothetical protein